MNNLYLCGKFKFIKVADMPSNPPTCHDCMCSEGGEIEREREEATEENTPCVL